MCQLKNFLLVLFTILTSKTYCQETDSLNFIKSHLPKYSDSERLVYTDNIGKWAYQRAKDNINEKFYDGTVRGGYKIAFRFTKSEKQYILQQLELCSKAYWSDALFDNSTMIKHDSLIQYFKAKLHAKRKIYSLIDTPGFSREFRLAIIKELNRRDWVFIFSKPIYIRNNTLAIWYLEPRCGWDCGYDQLAVYKKINGKWEKWFYIFSGAY